LTKICLT